MRLFKESTLSLENGLIKLKDDDWLQRQRIAGRCLSSIMTMLESLIKDKTTLTLQEISELAEEHILKQDCTPTFKGYKGFPAAVCISVNKQLVHGIPTDYKLQEGDVISFDFGTTYKGAIADSAITCIYGEPRSKEHVTLINATRKSLYDGIKAITVGKNLGVIGHAIFRSAKGSGFNVIANYGGHGLDEDKPHAPPFVANKADPTEGIRIQEGLAIAIEPMLVPYLSSVQTRVSKDGWTVFTDEIGAHFEHSVFVHKDHVEILTKREGEEI